MTELEMIEELKNFDTPSITNVVATYPDHPLCLGLYNPWSENWYTDQSLRCMYPELGRTVGYAVTCTWGVPDPNYSGVTFMDVLDAMDASLKPTIFVFQQKFPPELEGKVGLAGGNMTTAMQAIGCVGAISNGPSRDIDEIRPMKFQYLLSGVTAGHGAMAVHAVNVPVSVAGMDVAPGEIIHMDENGAVKFVWLLGSDEIEIARLNNAFTVYQGHHGDAGAAAVALVERLDERVLACDANRDHRAQLTAAEKADWEAELEEWTHETDDFSVDMIKQAIDEEDNWLHPRQVLRELEKAMPARVMVSTDIGNINSVANSYLRFEEPRSFFAAMSWGNCGYALPTIIGAKAAAPDRPAVSYAGDGAWAMSMVEVMTAVRHHIPVTAIVFHNRQWGAEKKNQVDFYGRRFVAGELEGGEDYSEIARAMGAEGVRVDQLEDVGPALRAAIDAQMNDGKTTVLEIMCTKELGDPFRKDALSRPVRNLEKFTDYV